MDTKFVTTLPNVVGYEIVESKGFIFGEAIWNGVEGAIKELKKEAEKQGCNAVVNMKIAGEATTYAAAYGDGVVVRPVPVELPEVPDFTTPDNL